MLGGVNIRLQLPLSAYLSSDKHLGRRTQQRDVAPHNLLPGNYTTTPQNLWRLWMAIFTNDKGISIEYHDSALYSSGQFQQSLAWYQLECDLDFRWRPCLSSAPSNDRPYRSGRSLRFSCNKRLPVFSLYLVNFSKNARLFVKSWIYCLLTGRKRPSPARSDLQFTEHCPMMLLNLIISCLGSVHLATVRTTHSRRAQWIFMAFRFQEHISKCCCKWIAGGECFIWCLERSSVGGINKFSEWDTETVCEKTP